MSLDDFKRIVDEMKHRTFECLEENEIVLKKDMTTGIISSVFIRDIQVGDYIWNGSDNFVRVTALNKKSVEFLVSIKLNYGRSILATPEHMFPTQNGLKKVKDISVSDKLLLATDNMVFDKVFEIDIVKFLVEHNACANYYIAGPVVQRICSDYGLKATSPHGTLKLEAIKNVILNYDYSDCFLHTTGPNKINTKLAITPELMYLLGHYIGNGSHRTYVISNTQTKMIENIEKALQVVFPNYVYTKNNKKNTVVFECSSVKPHKLIFDTVLECRNRKEKQLPNIIWRVSDEYKLMFLRGYFCDGNFHIVTKDGHYGALVFNTSSPKLAKDLCLLLKSLNISYALRTYTGGAATFSKSDPRIIHRKDRYRIYVGNFKELQKIHSVVSDHKNANKFFDMIHSQKEEKYLRGVQETHIEYIQKVNGPYNVVDINVDSEDHLFMTSHGIISHNCALGGRGDPDMHENFEEMLYYAATNHVVPNFTTSGLGMTPEKAAICKAHCGAVAVSAYSRVTDKPVIAWRKRLSNEEKIPYSSLSDVPTVFTLNNMNPDCYTEGENFVINNREYGWYYLHHFEKHQEMCMNGDYELYQVYEEKQEPNYTFKAIEMLLSAGVTTNIHFVLSNTTIDEAILRLKYKGFPAGINAVVFLLHKPVGLGDESDVLQYDDPRLAEFFALIDQQHDYKIGFDSCTIPAILNFSKHIDLNSVDTCEAARFSMYISSDMIALPCSFDNVNMKYAFDLKDGTIQDAWNSEAFNSFRNKFKTSCNNCPQYKKCLGGCPLEPSITLCKRKEKENGCKK